MATTVPIVVPTVAEAAAAFLATCTAASTRRSYTQTMTRLTAAHGTAPVTALDADALQELLAASWDGAAPATWNRHLATLGSFTTYAVRRPAPARTPATVDICPVTGRGRLSCQRAEYLFKQASLRVVAEGRPG